MDISAKRCWLKSIRESKKLTQTDVANAAGISLDHYQRIEYGQRNPALSIAKKISDCLSFPMEWFVEAPADGKRKRRRTCRRNQAP